jgi:hypothetical protein
MTLVNIFGLVFLFVFLVLIIVFSTGDRKLALTNFREIKAFSSLQKAVGLAVEAGSRIHLSIGRGNVIGPQSAIAFLSLSILERINTVTATSDRPILVSAGDGAWLVLSQDTIRATSQAVDVAFEPAQARLTGLAPFPFAVGALDIALYEGVETNVLVGNFGGELALISDAGERSGSLNIGGTDSIPGQAIMFAATHEPLIGEEVFAGGAYMGAGVSHTASLRAQDILRWALIAIIGLGAVLKLVGIL